MSDGHWPSMCRRCARSIHAGCIASFFLGENLGRFISGVGQVTPRPWWFYGPVVLGDGLPLSMFLAAAAVLWFRAAAPTVSRRCSGYGS